MWQYIIIKLTSVTSLHPFSHTRAEVYATVFKICTKHPPNINNSAKENPQQIA